MRSFTLAFLSTLLLSPISVLATYGEHGHHPEHSYQSDEVESAVSNTKDQSSMRVAIIAVTVDYLKSDVDHICNRKEETCLEQHECHKKGESCGRKNKCHEKKNNCFKEYDCQKKSKICHRKTTNRYGFRCGRKFYNQAKTLAAATAACKKIGKNSQRSVFPAPHTTFTYEKAGPYVEWPISRNGRFYNSLSKSKRRIVMTMDCAVVGAVVRHKGGEYTKCKYERH